MAVFPITKTPYIVGDVFAHYDASDSTKVQSSGGRVTKWFDSSGRGFDGTPSSDTYRPFIGVNTLNNLPVITFSNNSGNGCSLSLPSGFYKIPNFDNTVYALARATEFNSAVRRIIGVREGTNIRWGLSYHSQVDQIRYVSMNNSVIGVTINSVLNEWYILAASLNGSTLLLQNKLNTPASTSNGSYETNCNSAFIGAHGNGDRYLLGDIAEIIVYQGTHNTNQKTKIVRYLSDKWGVSI